MLSSAANLMPNPTNPTVKRARLPADKSGHTAFVAGMSGQMVKLIKMKVKVNIVMLMYSFVYYMFGQSAVRLALSVFS